MTTPLLDAAFPLDFRSLSRETFHRVYWRGQPPLKASVARNNRYDCAARLPAAKQFGVLYLGFDIQTCWMETVVRQNMVRPAGAPIQVPIGEMKDRWACEVTVAKPLMLAFFADESLIHLGDCASNIMGDSYRRTKRWSHLLHAHANPEVDGLLYRSRFRSSDLCIALFERAISSKGLAASNNRSINPTTSKEIQAIMRWYRVVPV